MPVSSGCGFACGDHVCWVYGSDDEHRRVVKEYLEEGLAAGEKLVYVGPRGREQRILEYLSEGGQSPHMLMRRGRLAIGVVEDEYVRRGRFVPAGRLSRYEKEVGKALRQGFSGLRVLGDAASLLGHPAVASGWPGFELRADMLATRIPLVAMCGYDLRECCDSDLELVKAVHGRQVFGKDVAEPAFRLYAVAPGALVLEGEIDVSSASALRQLLESAAEDADGLRVDVSRLAFIDIAGMRALACSESFLTGTSSLFRRMWDLLGFEASTAARVAGA